ncbi:glycosyltransferase family 4 protein [Oleiharenicola lentus]|uniref:glycosyltransferase family 4 protein n=1 Tax=Oleiharenicola lentus TaxID=2508720 RepID=UPI0013E919D5|nr:glycosyltransferase family 4 protein [Oleiharenicola lentus]
MSRESRITVLHYTGSRRDDGGVHAVIRNIAADAHMDAVLGVSPGYGATKEPSLPVWCGPAVADEMIGAGNLWPTLQVAWKIRSWLRAAPRRVYHGHSRAGMLVALWLHFLGEDRAVVSVHCYGRHLWVYRLAHGLLGQRFLWLSPAMKRHYGLPDLSWSGCMPNGLNASLSAVMRRGPGADGVLRLGGAGALVRWKRWDLVLEALARLPASAKVRFMHIGGALDSAESRACEQDLRAQTERLGLRDRVEWRGWQPSSAGLLAEVDAVVVPSDGEPFSMIALEAMFAGVPVIATRGGGPEDFIVEGVNGWLVPQGDAAALAARIEALLQPAAWNGLRVMPEHLRKFSMPETLAGRWAAIYASL